MFDWFKKAGVAVAIFGMSLPASATTLADALVQAYQTNPQILAQRAALRSVDESVISARASLLPALTQTMTMSRQTDYTQYGVGSLPLNPSRDPSTSLSLNTSLTIQLWDGGADRISVESARMTVLAARQALLQVEQDILFSTVQSFMNVRRDQQFVRLAQNNVRVLREQVRAAKDRFEVGEVTRTDVAQAEARLAAATSDLETSKGNLQQSINGYVFIVGSKPTNLRTPPAAPKIPSSADKAEAIAIKKHPRVMQAQFNAKAAELVSKATNLNRNPVVTGTLSHELGGNLGGNDFTSESLTAQIQGTWTIYQGGRLDSNRRRDVALFQQALSNVQQSGYVTRQSLRNAYATLDSAGASVLSNREQVRAAQVAFEGVREEAKLGARTTLDTLNAEQELLAARSQLVTANRDSYVAQYQVLAEMGLLTAQHLNLGVPIYNPDVYASQVTRKQISPLGDKRLKVFNKLKRRNGN